jgi:hypothetical protein
MTMVDSPVLIRSLDQYLCSQHPRVRYVTRIGASYVLYGSADEVGGKM